MKTGDYFSNQHRSHRKKWNKENWPCFTKVRLISGRGTPTDLAYNSFCCIFKHILVQMGSETIFKGFRSTVIAHILLNGKNIWGYKIQTRITATGVVYGLPFFYILFILKRYVNCFLCSFYSEEALINSLTSQKEHPLWWYLPIIVSV